jgi:hypothetical protein
MGTGGIEAVREVVVDFRDHIQWALKYFDRRFRRHETFSFVAFGIQQRRQALCSARIQMRQKISMPMLERWRLSLLKSWNKHV